MSEKNSLDKLFQKSIHPQEIHPPEMVWFAIEKSLIQKKKKRMVFLWITLSVVIGSSLLALILTTHAEPSNLNYSQQIQQIDRNNNKPSKLQISGNKGPKRIVKNKKNPTSPDISKTLISHKTNRRQQKIRTQENNSFKVQNPKSNNFISTSKLINADEFKNEENIAKNRDFGIELNRFKLRQPLSSLQSFKELELSNDSSHSVKALRKNSLTILTGPMFFSQLDLGSTYNTVFDQNRRSYGLPWNIGLLYESQLSQRLSIRVGLHTFGTKEITNGIGYISKTPGDFIPSDQNAVDNDTYIIANGTNPYLSTTGVISINNVLQPIAQKQSGQIIQKTRVIELPLEFGYTLVKRKVELGLFGGFGVLFLARNHIWFNPEDKSLSRVDLGANPNLNNVYSTLNAGFVLKYKIAHAFKIHFEPKLKYEIKSTTIFKNVYQMNFNVGVRYEF